MNVFVAETYKAEYTDAISQLVHELYEYRYKFTIHARQIQDIIDNPDQVLILASVNLNICGMALLTKIRSFSRTTFIFDELIVARWARGKGIGKAIENMVIKVAAESGVDSIEGGVPPSGVAAIASHIKAGFNIRPQVCVGMIFKHWEKNNGRLDN